MNSIAPFVESKSGNSILEGAIAAVEAVFRTEAPLEVKRALFDTACWLVSERDGKYKTRFRTAEAISAPKGILRHEHVIPRSHLWFVVRRTMTVADTLSLCDGCLVTTAEHKLLHSIDNAYGWERYAKAGISVIDTSTGKTLSRSRLLQLSKVFKRAFREARFVGDGEEELQMLKQ